MLFRSCPYLQRRLCLLQNRTLQKPVRKNNRREPEGHGRSLISQEVSRYRLAYFSCLRGMELVSTHHCGTGEVPYRCPKCFLPMDIVPPIWHCTIPPLRHTSVPHRCPKRNTSFMITHLCGTGYHPSLWYGNVPYRCPRYNVLRCIYPCIWYGG